MEPTDLFTVGERVVLQLYRYRDVQFNKYSMPFGLCQRGIGIAVGISRAHASIELKKLIDREQAECRESRVNNSNVLVKIYTLTPKGMDRAEELKKKINKNRIQFRDLFYDDKRWIRYGTDSITGAAKNDLKKAIEIIEREESSGHMPSLYPAAKLIMNALDLIIKHIVREE